jgi:hypothetical protein
MGDKTGEVAGRVGALEGQLKKLSHASDVEKTERKCGRATATQGRRKGETT